MGFRDSFRLGRDREGSGPDATPRPENDLDHYHQEIRDARLLLEYAVSRGLAVLNQTVQSIKVAEGDLSKMELPGAEARAAFEQGYRDLAALMRPVTAVTLRATDDRYGRQSKLPPWRNISIAKVWSRKLWFWLVVCLGLVLLGTNLPSVLSQGWPPLDEESESGMTAPYILALMLGYVLPFLYGWLGALTHLLRTCHDHLARREFDPIFMPEYYNRMLLGLVSGGAVLLFVDLPASGATKVTANAVAFLAGYNTDLFFSAIERVANALFPKTPSGSQPGASQPASTGLVSFKMQPPAVPAGTKSVGTVAIGVAAAAAGVTVKLRSDNASVVVPANIVINAGQTSATFDAVTTTGQPGKATITADLGGQSLSAALTVT